MQLFSESNVKRHDPKNVFESVKLFASQGRHAVRDVGRLHFPNLRGKVDTIVVAGMGGSALGAHVIQTASSRELRVPLVIVNDYHLPGWVNRRTLVVISSYSGGTEEPIAAWAAAKKAGAKITVIASGGTIARIARTNKLPAYLFTPTENPSGQPRIGLGYMTFGLLAILRKHGLLALAPTTIEEALEVAHGVIRKTDLLKPTSPVIKLSAALYGRAIFVVGGEHLIGAAHVLANQLNETAKTFSTWFAIPELNHHLMEGLDNPKQNVRRTTFLMLTSKMYSPRIQKRFRLTADIVRQNGARVEVIRMPGRTCLDQVAAALAYGGALTLALGIRYHIDPSAIHWVDYFKKHLAKK